MTDKPEYRHTYRQSFWDLGCNVKDEDRNNKKKNRQRAKLKKKDSQTDRQTNCNVGEKNLSVELLINHLMICLLDMTMSMAET